MIKKLNIAVEDGLRDAARIANRAVQDAFGREIVGNKEPEFTGLIGAANGERSVE